MCRNFKLCFFRVRPSAFSKHEWGTMAGLPTLTHMALWRDSHAFDLLLTQLTNLLTHFKKITRILTQFKKTKMFYHFYYCKTNCNIVYCFLAAESFVVSFIRVLPHSKHTAINMIISI